MNLRDLRNVTAVLAALLFLQSTAAAQIGSRVHRDTPVIFKADQLRNEQKLGIIVATGNVEFSQGERTLLADVVTYNRREDTVTATGNISLVEPTGEVIFADGSNSRATCETELLKTCGSGFPTTPVLPLPADAGSGGEDRIPQGRLFAMQALRKNPSQAPIWQVKAFDVTHDQTARDMVYKDAFLEFYGIP